MGIPFETNPKIYDQMKRGHVEKLATALGYSIEWKEEPQKLTWIATSAGGERWGNAVALVEGADKEQLWAYLACNASQTLLSLLVQ